MDWLATYGPQLGIFAPLAATLVWIIRSQAAVIEAKDVIIAALQKRNDDQNDKFAAALMNRAQIDTEILTFIRSVRK